MAEQAQGIVVRPEDGNAVQAVARPDDVAEPRDRRIAELRAQHREGSYEVDEFKLAAAIVDHHLRT